jgi:hypothetical protein
VQNRPLSDFSAKMGGWGGGAFQINFPDRCRIQCSQKPELYVAFAYKPRNDLEHRGWSLSTFGRIIKNLLGGASDSP